MNPGNPGNRKNDGNCCLSAAGNEVGVFVVNFFQPIDDRNDKGAKSRRRKVYDVFIVFLGNLMVAVVGFCRGCIKKNSDFPELSHFNQPINSLVGGSDPQFSCNFEAFGLCIDPGNCRNL